MPAVLWASVLCTQIEETALTTAEPNHPALKPAAHEARHPIHPMLVPFPIVCFVGALATDIAYRRTAEIMWADISRRSPGDAATARSGRNGCCPDYALSSHVAPFGMTFYTANALPPAYRRGAFVGERGSWNRAPLNGYKVVYVPFSNGKPSGEARDVVTGFLDNRDQARGRPVGLAIDKTGALLIADDVGNTVWRVTAAGG